MMKKIQQRTMNPTNTNTAKPSPPHSLRKRLGERDGGRSRACGIDIVKTLLLSGVMFCSASVITSAHALVMQEEPASAPDTPSDAPPDAPPDDAPKRIRFSFDGATLDQVIEFFSRETGLPVVREAAVPGDVTVRYHAPEAYELAEALRVLNVLLQTHDVMLRVDKEKLYLQKLEDMVRENIPTFRGTLPEEVTDDQIVVNVIPLQNALSKPMAERIKEMVASYGSVTSMDAQNSLVIVETAGKIRQLSRIIQELDTEDPQGDMEIFKIQHMKASEILKPLKGLLAERVQKYVINQNGEQKLLEEEEVRGLTITHDDRSNSIVAKGLQSKIEQLREAITLLDVPGGSTGRLMRTFTLLVLSPGDAVAKLNQLFERVPKEEKPTIVALESARKVTIIGSEEEVQEAEKLLAEIDDGVIASDFPGGENAQQQAVSVIPLEHGRGNDVRAALEALLNPRQLAQVRLLSGTDDRSLIIAGTARDVSMIETMIAMLDRPTTVERSVRLLQLNADDPQAAVDRALEIYTKQSTSADPATDIDVELDVASSSALVVGENDAVALFVASLEMVEEQRGVERERRQFVLQNVAPSHMVESLRAIAQAASGSPRGSREPDPIYTPLDELELIIVDATPAQLDIITAVIAHLDRPESEAMPPLRILQLRAADAANLAGVLTNQYNQRSAEEKRLRPVSITADQATNSLIVAAHPDMLSEIQTIVLELNNATVMDAEDREIRVFPLKVARADELARVIDEMYPAPEPLLDRRGNQIPGPQLPREVVVRADTQTNSLIVDATSQRMAGFEKLVEQLDRQKIEADTEVRVYPLQFADPQVMVNALNQLRDAGSLPGAADRRNSITITSEPMSRTLVVSGPSEIFTQVEELLKALDVRPAGPVTSLRFFTLESARAEALAPMLREILIARLADEMPGNIDASALLNVTTDRKTNLLIISAPDVLMPIAEEVIRLLDTGEAASSLNRVVRVRPLTFASAVDVGQSLSTAMPQLMSTSTGDVLDVEVIPTAGSNSIMLIGLEADLAQVETLIAGLDTQQQSVDEMAAESFSLEHADAVTIAPVLKRLLTNQQMTDPRIIAQQLRIRRGEINLTPEIQVEANQRTNTLLVSGTAGTVQLARVLIEQLDQPGESARSVTTFSPRHADPASLTASVSRAIEASGVAEGRTRLELVAEPGSGSIMVIGSEEQVASALAMLEQFDNQTPVAPSMDLTIIDLTNARADVVAPTVTSLLRDRAGWPEPLRQALARGVTIAEPTVTADASANRLLISAPPELIERARGIIEQLDSAPGSAPADIRIIALRVADATEAAAAINQAVAAQSASHPGELPPSISAAPSSNSLIISASPKRMQEIESLVASLDERAAPASAQVRTIMLKHARAEQIAPIMETLLAGGGASQDIQSMPRWMQFEMMAYQAQNASSAVRVVADPRLNAVIVSATPAELDVAEALVEQLDVDRAVSPTQTQREVRVISVQNMDASELIAALEGVFTEMVGDADEPAPSLHLSASSNSLIVRASASQFELIDSVIASLDRAAFGREQQMMQIPIDPGRANARDVAATLERLLETRSGSRVEVMTLEDLLRNRSNTADDPKPAPPSDEAVEEDRVGCVNDAQHVSMKVICKVQEQQDPQVHPRAGDADVTIAVDEATNTLIVIGSPRAVERVRALAEQVQMQLPGMPGRIRYIPLPESLDAQSLATVMMESLRALPGQGVERSSIAARASVIADPTANGLIVTANDADFEIVADLLVAMSNPPSAERLIVKVYPLANTSADRAAQSVRDLVGLGPAQAPARGRGMQTERMQRALEVELRAMGQTIEAVFDPSSIRISSDEHTNAIVVTAPDKAIAFIDRFVELIDQRSVEGQALMRMFRLKNAEAVDLTRAVTDILQARYNALDRNTQRTTIEPQVVADERTNALLITASPELLAQAAGLIEELDLDVAEGAFPLRIVELQHLAADEAADLLNEVVMRDVDGRQTMQIVPATSANVLLVRTSEEVGAEIDRVLIMLDRDTAGEWPVRTITLRRANPASVSETLQQLYDGRRAMSTRNRNQRDPQAGRRVTIVGDEVSKTLLIAASNEDFAAISELVKTFDSQEAAGLELAVYRLEHARASDISDQVQTLVNTLLWSDMGYWDPWSFGGGGRNRGRSATRDALAVTADQRLNALIVTGEGDKFEMVEKIIQSLDAPLGEGATRVVRIYRLEHADLNTVREVALESLAVQMDDPRRRWQPRDPHEASIRIDEATKSLIVGGSEAEHERVSSLVGELDSAARLPDQSITVLPVEFASAADIADILTTFLSERAEVAKQPAPTAVIVPSETANNLAVSANAADLATIRDLLSQLDRQSNDNRVMNIIALRKADAEDIARIISNVFDSRATGAQGVKVTADVRSNSVIVSAPREMYATAEEMIHTLDAPPPSDAMIIRTYALDGGAQATDVVRLLTESLGLDAAGEATGTLVQLEELGTEAVIVDARITSDRRSNSVVVRATPESIPVIEALIARFNKVETRAPVDWRIITLKHAGAYNTYWTLRDFLRSGREEGMPEPAIDYNEEENQLLISATPDQFKQIENLIAQIDIEREKPTTEFIKLQFADAEVARDALGYFYGKFAPAADTPSKISARVVANPATNSLLISAETSEWENIRALLSEIDIEEFDPSLQLKVIALRYADAGSVAQAINDAFQAQIGGNEQGNGRQPRGQGDGQGGGEGERRDQPVITQLVEVEDWVRASAEPMTNTVVVSASRQNMTKIEKIVAEIDSLEFAQGPPPRLIPVMHGSPEQFASSLREVYESSMPEARGRRGGGGAPGLGKLKIIANEASNTIIVRAEEDEYNQIRALAEALQQEAAAAGLGVHVLTLTAAPAARVERAIREAFSAKAEQNGQPLSIHADASGNSLIVACTAAMFAEIEATVKQLDALQPAAGQGIFIIELENIDPETATQMIETIGLNKPHAEDSLSRLVTEPITVAPLRGRNAIIVVANPSDRDTIIGILKAFDAQPEFGTSQMRIVRLANADAGAVADIITSMLAPQDQQSPNPLAQAVQEQVRRLSLRQNGVDGAVINLDLTTPIRVIVDDRLNSIILGSTAENVTALEAIVKSFDTLPITDAVIVQIYPLENIDVTHFERIVSDLFAQGKTLGEVPFRDAPGVPASQTGRALAGEIAMTADERTNTLVVAGTEEAVAFVDVMRQRLDSQVEIGWIEPRIIRLEHANAADLAETIQSILIDGAGDLPQSTPLQKQVGRIRSALGQQQVSDVFVPMTRLVVRAEDQLNALVVVGTQANLTVIEELVQMFDVPELAPDSKIRIYPVQHASASRVATTIERLFQQQAQRNELREEDRITIEADERTNALVVSTSESSFRIVESLLESLDAEVAADFAEIRRIPLTTASATRLEQIIQQLMDARYERIAAVDPEGAELEKASIVADSRTNSLIVAASNDAFGVIQRIIAELDDEHQLQSGEIEIIKLEKGNGDRLADVIAQIMERRYAELPADVREAQRPLIMVDARTNSLLVAASPEDVRSIRALVDTLEATDLDPLVAITVLPLETKRAQELAPRLERLMRERMETLGAARTDADRVSIEADPASNSLIVSAPPEHLEALRTLVDALIKAEEGAPVHGIDVINLARIDARNVVDVIDEMYVAGENARRGPDTIRISADERLNALLVSAPEGDIARIRALVERLEGRQTDVFEIQTIPLSSADPLEIVGLLEDVLRGPGLGGRRNADQAVVFKLITQAAEEDGIVRDDAVDEVEISMAIRESISLVPDRRTNSVIVTAPKESMALIRQLIQGWDQSETGNLQLRVFTLVNADADATAAILTQLFRTPEREVLMPVNQQQGLVPDENALDAAPTTYTTTELTQVPDQRKQLSITVDSRTNSLLVAGTPRYLELVEQVVEELDSETGNEREQTVVALKNAVAEEVARVVGQFVDQDQEKLLGTLPPDQLGSATRLLEREVTIVGDQKSNTLLVSASPRYMRRVLEMIDQLDVDPPQVLIQVLLAEITLDSGDEWGVDFGVTARTGDVNVGAGFGLASAFLSGMGVPNLSVVGSDFELLLRALESQGRLQVLSNPSIMAANNEPAEIQIGETIRVPSNLVTSGNSSRDLLSVEPVDLGVILNVTPTINPEGFVRLDINPEISNLSTRETQLSEGFSSPVITVRRADTTVTVLDGQTIVLGGLISDRFEIREEAVPFLADLPILGKLFRSKSEQRAKTELLIVLTPHVITSPTGIRPDVDKSVGTVTNKEIDRLSLPESIKQQIRRGELDSTNGVVDLRGERINRLEELFRQENESTINQSPYWRDEEDIQPADFREVDGDGEAEADSDPRIPPVPKP
ncbi:MAG: secretin N-terminal domain-containing protein [Phycisphaerales bacterium]